MNFLQLFGNESTPKSIVSFPDFGSFQDERKSFQNLHLPTYNKHMSGQIIKLEKTSINP